MCCVHAGRAHPLTAVRRARAHNMDDSGNCGLRAMGCPPPHTHTQVAAMARDPGAVPVAGDDVSDARWMRVSQLAGLGGVGP